MPAKALLAVVPCPELTVCFLGVDVGPPPPRVLVGMCLCPSLSSSPSPTQPGAPQPSPGRQWEGQDGRGQGWCPPRDLQKEDLDHPWPAGTSGGSTVSCGSSPSLLVTQFPRRGGACPAVGQRRRARPGGRGHCWGPSSWREAARGALRKETMGQGRVTVGVAPEALSWGPGVGSGTCGLQRLFEVVLCVVTLCPQWFQSMLLINKFHGQFPLSLPLLWAMEGVGAEGGTSGLVSPVGTGVWSRQGPRRSVGFPGLDGAGRQGLVSTGRGWWVPGKLREPPEICVLDVGGGGQQAGPSGFRESIPRTSHRWVQA